MEVWAKGLHHATDLLIRRGSAMGPLLPVLLLVPILVLAIWLFKDVAWLRFAFAFFVFLIIAEYLRQFAKFSRNDPDRLQSEEYRYEMQKIQMIAAKELPYPVPAESLPLSPATSNPSQPLPNADEVIEGLASESRVEPDQ